MSLRFLAADGALLARARVPGSFAAGSCAPIEFRNIEILELK